jgi:hypothetical protein
MSDLRVRVIETVMAAVRIAQYRAAAAHAAGNEAEAAGCEKPSSASSGSERRIRTNCGYLGMTICRSDQPLSLKLEDPTGLCPEG